MASIVEAKDFDNYEEWLLHSSTISVSGHIIWNDKGAVLQLRIRSDNVEKILNRIQVAIFQDERNN